VELPHPVATSKAAVKGRSDILREFTVDLGDI